jgi:hypothetical protein
MPAYVLTANALELTMTVKGFNGVVPALTLVESQLPPPLVDDVTVKAIPAAPSALPTLSAWLAGLEPRGAAKVSEVGNTVMFPVLPLLTVRVALTVCTAPLEVKEMVAVYVVPAAKPVGLADTVRLAGVVPVSGLTVSQPDPLA